MEMRFWYNDATTNHNTIRDSRMAPDQSLFEQWIEAATDGTYTPLSEERINEMFEATCRSGSANGWAGTTGKLAWMIRELLRERQWLIKECENEVQ